MSDKNTKVLVNDFYKGYDIKWLRTEESHPEYYLVAEYDALKKKPKKVIEPIVEAEEETNGES